MFSDFWTNKMWRHKDVAWAISETILMAFLGTFLGAVIALPLAFVATSNFTRFASIRFAMRRVFDFVRGVDGLIWTIILARAFGPGPMTGALAILITDTGAFGKQFSEMLENIDEKQVEAIRSTGANALQRARFGVILQITPVLLGQVLYNFESNTRSATIIGATDHPMDRAALHHFMYRSADLWDDAPNDTVFLDHRKSRRAVIGHDTWLGHACMIKPDVTVGHGAIVAAGAIVTRDVAPYTIVAGTPAKLLRLRQPPDIADQLIALAWWDWDHGRIRAALDDFRAMSALAFLNAYGG